jgi:geranyl-CoA carboxylase alpha subunit
VPCAPGYLGEEQDDTRLTEEALKLGFPLLVKAVAGGGGRGMRLVREAGEIKQAIVAARREAQNAFGDGTLMLERLIDNGRHIEIQVFADAHGHAVYLGERDCTAQRRRQKVIEEAPSPVVSSAMRESMGKDAVAAALAVGYRGAGTVEFIVDADLKHYFLEMNTRLQVEHPVTELVTGFDLVEWQLLVAAGQPLPATQADIKLTGHAIEARLYVEDPYAGFAPQTGTVRWWRPQQALLAGVRIDDGIEEGGEISPYYDAMVAKVIVHGRDRDEAIRRLRAALEDAPLLGLRNNGRFLSDLVNHPAFRAAAMTTTLIDQWQEAGEALLQRPLPGDEAWCVVAAALAMQNGANWRADSVAAFDMPLRCDELTQTLRIHPDRSGQVTVTLGGQKHLVRIVDFKDGELRFEIDGVTRTAVAVKHQQELHIALGGASFVFHEVSPFPGKDAALDATRALSPVAGKVTQIQFAIGEGVKEGQALVCVEAMKMEMWLTAQAAGTVVALHVKVGEQVESGALLIEIELEDQKET